MVSEIFLYYTIYIIVFATHDILIMTHYEYKAFRPQWESVIKHFEIVTQQKISAIPRVALRFLILLYNSPLPTAEKCSVICS